MPILKFYRGFTVTITGMIPYAGTSFLAWGYLRSVFVPYISSSSDNKRVKPTPVAGLSIGGYLKVVPMTAVSFAVWQWARRMLGL